MAIDSELIDRLLADYKKPEDIIGENGLLKQLTKAVLERALQAEMTDHLGYEKHDPVGQNTGNSRNGKTTKSLKGEFGELPLETPRDRNGSFEPKIVSKGQTRFAGFDSKILSLYARGMSTREIQGHLEEIYGVEVSPTLISNVTEAVMEDVRAWQNRPLDAIYPIVYLDALYLKIRDSGHIQNKAIYVVIGVNVEGSKEVLGLWAGQSEGAKFWLQVLTELKNRGVADIFIACVDGLKGFPQAIETVFPKTQVQLCIVHLLRSCLNYVSWKQRKQVAADLKPIYRASTAEDAGEKLEAFAAKMGWRVSDAESDLASELGAGNSILCLPGRNPQSDLHDQRGRVAEHVAAQGDQNSRLVSQRRGRHQTAVPSAGAYRQTLDSAPAGLERRSQSLRHSFRGSLAQSRFGLKNQEGEL